MSPGEGALEALLEDLRDDGRAESSGGFSLDPVRGLELLRTHLEPDTYVLHLVSAALVSGAQRLDLALDSYEFSLSWHPRLTVEASLLERLDRYLLSEQSQQNLFMRELAIGFYAAAIEEPIEMFLDGPAGRLRLVDHRPALEPGSIPHFRFYRRLGTEARRLLQGLVNRFPEEVVLRRRCRHSPVPIWLNRQPLPRGAELERTLFVIGLEDALVAFCRREQQVRSRLTWVVNGVDFEAPVRGLSQAETRVIGWNSTLTKDLTDSGLVDNDHYQAVRRRLRGTVAEAAVRAVAAVPAQLTGRDGRGVLLMAADSLRRQARLTELARVFELVLEDRARELGPDHPATRRSLTEQAWLEQLRAGRPHEPAAPAAPAQQRLEQAEVRLRTGPSQSALSQRAVALFELGRAEEAEKVAQAALRQALRNHGAVHPETAGARSLLAGLALATRRPEALDLLAQADQALGPELAGSHHHRLALRACRVKAGGNDPDLLELAVAAWGADHPCLAWLYEALGQPQRALELAALACRRPWRGDPFFGLPIGYGGWFTAARLSEPVWQPFMIGTNLECQRLLRRLLRSSQPELASAVLATRVGCEFEQGQVRLRVDSPRSVVGVEVGDVLLPVLAGQREWVVPSPAARVCVVFDDGFAWTEAIGQESPL
ncbi:MAG: tetratricopeptide repeat protein [Vulcanimicrobiota bacterium]